MSGLWPLVKLGDYVDIQTGFPFKSSGYSDKPNDVRLLRGDNIAQGYLRWQDAKRWPREDASRFSQYSLEVGDVVLAMDRPWIEAGLKHAWIAEEDLPCLIVQRVARIKSNKEALLTDFIRYIIGGYQFSEYSRAIVTGINVPHISEKQIRNFEFRLPPLHKQEKIVATLFAYDELIENNMHRIAILEDMAQTLYHEWFVCFRYPEHESMETLQTPNGQQPKEWVTTTLSAIVDNVKEKEKTGDHLLDLAYIPIDCISRKRLFLDRVESGKEAKSSLIRFAKYDVLFGAMRSYFHKVAIAPSNGITRTTCFVLRPRSPLYYCYSVMTLFQESTVQYANSRSKGSTIPYAVWENGLADMPILLPDENTLEKFNSIIMPIVEEIVTTHFKIGILRNMRDILLPRLISGELMQES